MWLFANTSVMALTGSLGRRGEDASDEGISLFVAVFWELSLLSSSIPSAGIVASLLLRDSHSFDC